MLSVCFRSSWFLSCSHACVGGSTLSLFLSCHVRETCGVYDILMIVFFVRHCFCLVNHAWWWRYVDCLFRSTLFCSFRQACRGGDMLMFIFIRRYFWLVSPVCGGDNMLIVCFHLSLLCFLR